MIGLILFIISWFVVGYLVSKSTWTLMCRFSPETHYGDPIFTKENFYEHLPFLLTFWWSNIFYVLLMVVISLFKKGNEKKY